MRTTTTSHSQSASVTYLTSAVNSDGLSNTTALTRSSTSATLTRVSTSSTVYGTSAGTNTMYSQQFTYITTGYAGVRNYSSTGLATIIGTASSSRYHNTSVWFSRLQLYGKFTMSTNMTYSRSTDYQTYIDSGTTIVTYTAESTSLSTLRNNSYTSSYGNSHYFATTLQLYSAIEKITTATNHLTRSSASGYGTRVSTSGYSGVSSSSSSESASGTCWE